jgi:hypothetical protein
MLAAGRSILCTRQNSIMIHTTRIMNMRMITIVTAMWSTKNIEIMTTDMGMDMKTMENTMAMTTKERFL